MDIIDNVKKGRVYSKDIANMMFRLTSDSQGNVSLFVFSYYTLIYKITFTSDFSDYVCGEGRMDMSYYSRTTTRHQGICAWLEIYFKFECFKQPEKRIEMLEKIFTEYRALRDFGYMSKAERREWGL